jgi:hypothetical protein
MTYMLDGAGVARLEDYFNRRIGGLLKDLRVMWLDHVSP